MGDFSLKPAGIKAAQALRAAVDHPAGGLAKQQVRLNRAEQQYTLSLPASCGSHVADTVPCSSAGQLDASAGIVQCASLCNL